MCGNSFFEVGEQCDNGGLPGCVNCVADPNYDCGSTANASALPC